MARIAKNAYIVFKIYTFMDDGEIKPFPAGLMLT